MGAVYKGVQRSLDRPVAIKILSAELDEREQGFAERFKNEAKAMAKLNHPGIVGVHDFGATPEGMLFIGMEFISGTDVSRMLAKKGKLPPDHAMAITAHVCDALAYAHKRGIIHRDIKPANIMVGYDGVVKVSDFGLAKMSQSADSGLTQSGVAMGTMHYMAPETLTLGTAVDHRADIYAVGVMLYEMLTGKLPRGMFDPPSKQIPGLDPRYDDIIAKAIRDEREIRYQSAEELRGDLDLILTKPVEHVVEGADEAPAALPTAERPKQTGRRTRAAPVAPPLEETPAPAPRKSGNSWLLGAGVVVLALVAGAWLVMHRPDAPLTNSSVAKSQAGPVATTQAAKPKPAGPKPWPTGPNFRSAGRFRAWSSIPDDPVIDLANLKNVAAAKQVHIKEGSWVVLLPTGEVRSNDRALEQRQNIRRICRGWENFVGLIDNDGKLAVYPQQAIDTQALEGVGPVKDAYISPHHRVALLEDGNLVVWGRGYDGIAEQGNPEWKEKPALPPGRKAVAISSSDNTFAVQLDDGSLRVWSVAGGLIQPPAQYAAGKLDAFAIIRGSLFGIPNDGSPALQWNLNGQGKAVHLPGNPIGTCLLPTNHGMLVLDKGGLPRADKSFTSPVAGVAQALGAVHPVGSEMIAAYRSTKTPVTVRMLWMDESAPAPPAVADQDWPDDGPCFGSEGRFRAWSSTRYDKTLNLSKLRGVDDVVQVYQGAGYWVVLRANGDTITSFDGGERKNIRHICPGAGPNFALIRRDGSVEIVGANPESVPPDLTPPAGLKATDAFVSAACWGLGEDGGLRYWGRNFDGKKEEGNGEWPVKPVLPQGRKAVAISHSEFLLAAQVENQSLLLWRGGGPVKLPATLRAQKFSHFALTNQTLFGVLADGGLPVMWTPKDSGLKPVPALRSAASVQEAGKFAVCFFSETGKPTLMFEEIFDKTLFDQVLPHVDGAAPDLCSFRVDYNGKNDACFGRMLWYDAEGRPAATKIASIAPSPATSVASTVQSPASPKPGAAAPKAPASPALDQIPEFRSRVLNYQQARHAKLSDLVGKYRKALTTAHSDATKSGAQADASELDAAIARTTALFTAIEKNRTSVQVKPLPALAPLGTHVPKRLQDLRAIFDQELNKIEASLVAGLDQSLLHVQTQLVKTMNIPTAQGVESFRKDLLAAFSKPTVGAPSPAGGAGSVTPMPAARADALSRATKDKPFVNSLGMRFVPLPGTKLLMCAHETRRGDYATYAKVNPGVDNGWEKVLFNGEIVSAKDDHPVVLVNRVEARSFCVWLSGKEGRKYRLPTDREWSVAVGLGDLESATAAPPKLQHGVKNQYPWGTEWPPGGPVGNLPDLAYQNIAPGETAISGYNDNHATTAPVMSFAPNALGIYDLAGNVWEWCDNDYQGHTGLARGSHWRGTDDMATQLLSSHRQTESPAAHSVNGGFRVIMELP